MIVVLGGSGFVGSTVVNELTVNGFKVESFSSKNFDLSQPIHNDRILELLDQAEQIIYCAAKAPAKNYGDLVDNVLMLRHFLDAVRPTIPALYLSSDAVYEDSDRPLTENSDINPLSYHGMMHITREFMFTSHFSRSAVVRPTLIYGSGDPHNGYGPNKFFRQALAGEDIKLFGNGEELRDHVHVEDVAKLICEIVSNKSQGVFNAVSGQVISFSEIASKIQTTVNTNIKIRNVERQGPMPHNGYRAFDNSLVAKQFPKLHFRSFAEGLLTY